MRDVMRLMVIAAVGCLGLAAAAGETPPDAQGNPACYYRDGWDADPGQPVIQFQFAGIDKAAVQEVLLTSSTGRCFVIGPTGS